MPIDAEDYFELSLDELREVTRFALAAAEPVLQVFETAVPGDDRPRTALTTARAFADGGPRTHRQRVVAADAHRAGKTTPPQAAHAAAAAGEAAAAAYLHPVAKASQVGHILRAAAHAACVHELTSADPSAANASLARAAARATPTLVAVLRRYPPASPGRTRVAVLMHELDTALRAR